MKPHYTSTVGPSGKPRQLGKRMPERQAVISTGGRVRNNEARVAKTIAKWDQGTAEIEREMAKARARKHRFVPMGRLPSCEACGVGIDATHTDGTRVHYLEETSR